MLVVLVADLACLAPAALAQAVTFEGQQMTVRAGLLNQPSIVAVDVACASVADHLGNRVVEVSEGGGTQRSVSGGTNPSIMSSFVCFDGGTTAFQGLTMSPPASAASLAGHSPMADTGTLSANKCAFNLTTGALPFTKAMSTSALNMPGGSFLSATRLHTTSALLGRPTAGMILGASAEPRLKAETGKESQTIRYWTLRRKIETAGVTLLHMADAAQTCWHEANTPRWFEQNSMTPNSCPGASVVLVGSGPIFQWVSYRLTQRYPHSHLWARLDHVLPQMEIAISAMSIRCSHSGSCNQYGF